MSAKKVVRYRATIVEMSATLPELYPTRERAIKAAVDQFLLHGGVTVEEVPVRKRTKTEWVEEVK